MKTPSPIFHVDGERGLRGGERQLLYLAAALDSRGRRGVVWCREGAALESEARRLGLETRTLPFLCEADPFSAARLAAAARKEGAILHAHTGHAAGLCALASLAGVPYVAHRRVDFPVGALSARVKYGRAGRVVAVSEAIAEILRGCGVPADRIAVVPDAIPVNDDESAWVRANPGDYRPPTPAEKSALRRKFAQALGLDPAAPWIGNLAALAPHKDHGTLIAAARLVLRRRPDARVLIAGEGPEKSRLQDLIHRFGLAHKVFLLGQREDAPSLLKALDVYAQSSWGEGMGSVLIEAAACGVPVAATTAGGIPEVVENGAAGLLVPPRDPELLAGALLRLLEDRALAARLSTEALRRLPAFGLSRMAQRLDALYIELEKS
ncbi:MAG: glycosyltransferase [Elusimicrobia bacterium]|nr:glycosyltransferase [Elusimicrobiota bacterium]